MPTRHDISHALVPSLRTSSPVSTGVLYMSQPTPESISRPDSLLNLPWRGGPALQQTMIPVHYFVGFVYIDTRHTGLPTVVSELSPMSNAGNIT